VWCGEVRITHGMVRRGEGRDTIKDKRYWRRDESFSSICTMVRSIDWKEQIDLSEIENEEVMETFIRIV
jgi:hypothetical protein